MWQDDNRVKEQDDTREEEHDLALLIRAGTPLISIETHEEQRAVALFKRVISKVWRPLFCWTVTEGLLRLDLDMPTSGQRSIEPEAVLRSIKKTKERSIFLLMDFHPYLEDPTHLRLIREITQSKETGSHSLVFISPELDLPRELGKLAAGFELAVPDEKDLEKMVREEAYQWSRQHSGRRVKVNKRSLDMLIRNLGGLTLRDARRLARNAIYQDGAITDSDLPEVMRAKFELMNAEGVLSFEFETAQFADVAGLVHLKQWIDQRKLAFIEDLSSRGLDAPKGVLLLGVQGCGKSLAAKAVAGGFGVPLLRLDFGAVYNKYHGETERNLRDSLKSAVNMKPCVLWIDEIEKGLSMSDSDGGTSNRVLGTLLTWMAEENQQVFIVATANDIESLPPELVRKGRFDEIFFVDLPSADVRQEILKIHINKRGMKSADFELDTLVAASDGFSGAELEQAVVSSLYAAFASNDSTNTEHILQELQNTKPLSIVMAEKVNELRRWAKSRTVPAG